MRPILFSIGSINFYSYGFLLAVGFLLALGLAFWLAAKSGQIKDAETRSQFLDLILYSVLAGLLGGRVGHIVLFPAQYRGVSFWEALLKGGFSFYPAVLAGIVVFVWLVYLYRRPLWNWLGLAILAILTGKVIGHIGGHLSLATPGKPAPKFLALGATTYPIHLYLAIWSLVGLLVLVGAIFRKGIKSLASPAQARFIFLFGTFWIVLGNFLIDFLLAERKLYWILTLSQWVSLVIGLSILVWFIWQRKKPLKSHP